jgi:two-component system, NarL family, sensor kinase
MAKHITLLLLFAVSFLSAQDPHTVDSLSRVWKDERMADTVRLHALDRLFLLFERSFPDSALILANQQLDHARKTRDLHWEARANVNLADLYNRKGHNPISISYYQKSLEIFIKLKDALQCAEIMHKMGVSAYYDGAYNDAMRYDLKALEYFESIKNEDGIADIYHDLGKISYRQKQYDLALKNYQRSLDLYERLGDKHGAASSLNNMAGVYSDQEDYHRMLIYLQRSLKLVEELGEKNGVATRVHNIGYVYQKLKKHDQAMSCFVRGLRIREELMDEKGISYSLNSIGQVYAEKGELATALDYLNRSLKSAQSIGVKEAIRSAYEELAKVYYKMHRYKEAFDHHLLLSNLKDSIFTEESAEQIAEMQTRFETEKKEKELQLQKAQLSGQDTELKKQATEKIALFIGLSLLLLLAIVLVRSNKGMKRANVIISSQKRMVEEQKSLVELQKEQVEEKNKSITDSINYAKRIQQSHMPSERYIDQCLKRLNKWR